MVAAQPNRGYERQRVSDRETRVVITEKSQQPPDTSGWTVTVRTHAIRFEPAGVPSAGSMAGS